MMGIRTACILADLTTILEAGTLDIVPVDTSGMPHECQNDFPVLPVGYTSRIHAQAFLCFSQGHFVDRGRVVIPNRRN